MSDQGLRGHWTGRKQIFTRRKREPLLQMQVRNQGDTVNDHVTMDRHFALVKWQNISTLNWKYVGNE
jgi:hypothetical protein